MARTTLGTALLCSILITTAALGTGRTIWTVVAADPKGEGPDDTSGLRVSVGIELTKRFELFITARVTKSGDRYTAWFKASFQDNWTWAIDSLGWIQPLRISIRWPPKSAASSEARRCSRRYAPEN